MSQVLCQTKETTANAGINLSPTVGKIFRQSSEKCCKTHKYDV